MSAAPVGIVGPVAVGDLVPPLSVQLTRADLVRYAGASGDFNPIHWSDRVAGEVGLPGVIAHGMLTMAMVGRLAGNWAGGPAAVRGCSVRFTRPVVVPDDDDGATVELSGQVTAVTDTAVTVAVTATSGGRTVLGKAVAELARASG